MIKNVQASVCVISAGRSCILSMFSMAVGDASPNVCKQNNFGTAQIMYTANMNKLLISKDTILHFCDEKTFVFVLIWEYTNLVNLWHKKKSGCLVNGGKSQFGLSNLCFGLELTKQFQFECKQKTPEKSTEHSKSIQKLNSNINYYKFISTDSSVTLIIPALFWQNTKWKTRYFASGFAACGP